MLDTAEKFELGLKFVRASYLDMTTSNEAEKGSLMAQIDKLKAQAREKDQRIESLQ